MKFERQQKLECGLQQVDIVPFMNLILLLLIFFILSLSLTSPLGINVKLPKAVTSDVIREDNIVLMINSENVLYFNRNVVTLKELIKKLEKIKGENRLILIKADRRASVGRIVDVWNLCRQLGIERINIATTQEE